MFDTILLWWATDVIAPGLDYVHAAYRDRSVGAVRQATNLAGAARGLRGLPHATLLGEDATLVQEFLPLAEARAAGLDVPYWAVRHMLVNGWRMGAVGTRDLAELLVLTAGCRS